MSSSFVATALPRSLVEHNFLLLGGEAEGVPPVVTSLAELIERCPPLGRRAPLPRPLVLALLLALVRGAVRTGLKPRDGGRPRPVGVSPPPANRASMSD